MNSAGGAQRVTSTVADPRFQARLRRRYASERRFRWVGRIALALGGAFLALILGTIVANGYSAWQQTFIALEIHFDPERLDPDGRGTGEALAAGDYGGLVKASLRAAFPEMKKRRERRQLQALVSPGASFHLRDLVLADPSLVGATRTVWLPADDDRRHAPQGARRPLPSRGLTTAERPPARDRGRVRRARRHREALQTAPSSWREIRASRSSPEFAAPSSAPPSPWS